MLSLGCCCPSSILIPDQDSEPSLSVTLLLTWAMSPGPRPHLRPVIAETVLSLSWASPPGFRSYLWPVTIGTAESKVTALNHHGQGHDDSVLSPVPQVLTHGFNRLQSETCCSYPVTVPCGQSWDFDPPSPGYASTAPYPPLHLVIPGPMPLLYPPLACQSHSGETQVIVLWDICTCPHAGHQCHSHSKCTCAPETRHCDSFTGTWL